MSDAQVVEAIARIRAKAVASGDPEAMARFERTFSMPVGPREQLKAAYQAALPQMVRTMATKIAEAGGAVPFLLTAKRQLREIQEQGGVFGATAAKSKANRMPADFCELEGLPLALVVLGFVLAPVAFAGEWAVPALGVGLSIFGTTCLVTGLVLSIVHGNKC